MTLRVVVLDHTAEPGGAELALLRVVEALGRRARVHVLLFEDGPMVRRLREAGATTEILALAPRVVHRGRYDVSARSLGAAWRTVTAVGALIGFELRLALRLRRLRPDVVHATSLKADVLSVVPAGVARRPLVWHVHDRIAEDYLPAPLVRAFRWAARHLPTAVVANSRATALTLPGARGLTVVRPGLAPGQVRDRPRPAPAVDVVGLVGRLSATKGQLELVRAAPAILRSRPGTRFRFVGAALFGADEYVDAVREEIDRLGLTDVVEWAGFVDDPRPELDAMAVCVHASPVAEPYGQVVAEALARGVPVVATRAGGVPEILEPSDDAPARGVLVPPGDVAALANGVLSVLENRAVAEQRARDAHLDAGASLGIDRTAEGLLTVWQDVAGRRARHPSAPPGRPRS